MRRLFGMQRAKQGCLAGVAVVVIAGLIGAGWLYRRLSLEPTISRNYAAEYNAEIEKIPESDRAWPIYRDALVYRAMQNRDDALVADEWHELRDARPGDPAWDVAVELFETEQPMLDLAIRAAAKQRVGYVLSDEQDPELRSSIGQPVEKPSENPRMMEILIPHVGIARRFAIELLFDARVAMANGDAALFLQRLQETARVASQAREGGFIMAQHVGLQVAGLLHTEIMWWSQESPESFSDADMVTLDNILRTMEADGLYEVSFHMDRLALEDLVQRTYSDDGHGDGVLTRSGARELHDMVGSLMSTFGGTTTSSVPSVFRRASRKQLAAYADEFFEAAMQTAERRLYGQGTTPSDVIERYMPTQRKKDRYFVAQLFMPPVGQAVLERWQARTTHDAARTIVAVERYKRDHGAMPETLDLLVPEYLDLPPPDMYVDAPLGWALTEFGWTLYSVGRNGTDEGGNPATSNAEQPTNGDTNQPSLRPGAPRETDWVIYPIFHAPVTGHDGSGNE